MHETVPRRRLELIEAVARAAGRAARTRGAQAAGNARAGDFLRAYLRGVDAEDLACRETATLARVALAHLALGRRRRPGTPALALLDVTAAPSSDAPAATSAWLAVVTDDMPFLVDSLGMALGAHGITVKLLVHPVLAVQRDRGGRLRSVALATPAVTGGGADGALRESWQLYEIEPPATAATVPNLLAALRATLADVRVAVDDWLPMRARMRELAAGLRQRPPRRTPRAETDEGCALLDWMESGHFVFLGYRHYRLRRGRSADRLEPRAATGLGLMRAGHDAEPGVTTLRGRMRAVARSAAPLVVSKANWLATVHRATYLDYVAVKDFDADGVPVAEHRFIGLWTSTAYFSSPGEIPLLRRKVREVIASLRIDAGSHDGKAVMAVLEGWPRDELFQSGVRELTAFVRSVVNLYERRTTRLLARRDPFGRFWSFMAYVPRDRYSTEVRHRIEQALRSALDGTALESQVQISGSNHARLHVVVRAPVAAARLDVAALERRIALAATTWNDRLRSALVARAGAAGTAGESHDPRNGSASRVDAPGLAARYAAAFPLAYQDEVEPATALADIDALEALLAAPEELRLALYRAPARHAARLHLRIVRAGEPLAISDLLPPLENFGLRVLAERPWRIALPQLAGGASIQDFELEHAGGRALDVAQVAPRFVEAFQAVWRGAIEDDGFNRLLLETALDARRIVVLRATGRYLLQTGLPFSQRYMERVLGAHPAFAADLVRLFEARLDPDGAARGREARAARLATGLERRLAAVASADDDRILRAFLAVVMATLRSNFWQRDAHGAVRPTLALKLDPRDIPGLPLPRPQFEIYVYAPTVEGVHLRMGHVARGGIRWSDRREDFRTEILGLMKAQNVKNTLIVPVGAKGGFVPRRLTPGATREVAQAEGIAAYRSFIGALLDVTDNIVDGRVVPPPRVLRRDGEDAYLVVAADKGTASFSDLANAIAVERGFWLGDAFASGGSAGYDHKKMGITARGAWECVKRHFRELGLDVHSTPFTVAGIGDMSGDVFGNGMLLSPAIRLVAAFNHQHLFLDPSPDAAAAAGERRRLFALPRSGWDDYDRRLLSRGGGIHRRDAKSIPLAPEARRLLGLDASVATPQEVIRAILRMPVDLLWNGGIGTYVKASTESQAEAGDRANDAVRVDGRELRARVVGEGGNLGFTQRGRVEYALGGGRINTDFIDNSAGVNTSDVEVNLKILTNAEERRGALRRRARDRLLSSLGDDVAQLVLRNNYLQGQALSILEARAARRMPELVHTLRHLERDGLLSRAVEFLPDDQMLAERRQRGHGMTRPELAVLLSYSKIALNQQLLASDVPEDPYLSRELDRYFPPRFVRRFPRALARHRLRREIIATATTNSVVNRMGPSFVPRALDDTGADAGQVARAYSAAREIFGMRGRWAAIEALDDHVPAALQYAMHDTTARLLRHASYWLLRHRRARLDVDAATREFAPAVAALVDALPEALAGAALEDWQRNRSAHGTAGVPAPLAEFLADCEPLDAAFDIAGLARARRVPVALAAAAWFQSGARLGLDWLRAAIERLEVDDPWDAVARGGLREAALQVQRELATQVLAGTARGPVVARIERWSARHAAGLPAWQRSLAEMRAAGSADFAMLSVGVEALRKLVG